MEKTVMVYITAPSRAAALKMGRVIVRERLAACVNVLGPIDSVYWWEGRVQSGREAALIAKTRRACLPALVKRVRRLHDYDCPCIVSWPLGAGHVEFLRWIRRETRGAERKAPHADR